MQHLLELYTRIGESKFRKDQFGTRHPHPKKVVTFPRSLGQADVMLQEFAPLAQGFFWWQQMN